MRLTYQIIQCSATFFVAVLAALFLLVPRTRAYYTNMPASVIVGASNFTDFLATTSQTQLKTAITNTIVVNGKLIVCDKSNNRVLIWNTIPANNGAPADVVLGQPDFVSNTANNGGETASTFSAPSDVASDGTKLLVADRQNYRILIWNTIPTTNFAAADVVIGQNSFTSSVTGQTAQNRLNRPEVVHVSSNGKLFVGDSSNNRVLIFNSIPTSNFANADVVIGQPDFITSGANHGGIGANTINIAQGILTYKNRLLVADQQNNRVLIWNAIPTINNVNADVVIGQADFITSSANQGGSTTKKSLSAPNRMTTDGAGRLLLADSSNNRVLIFNALPVQNNASADIVFGQPDFVSNTANNGGRSANSINFAISVFHYNNQLFISDSSNARVLIFNNQLPDVSLSRTITSQPNGLLRFFGTASTNAPNQRVIRVEYSVNGGTWTGTFPTDGKFDSTIENYYFDFNPTINEIADQQGYTIKIRSTHDNDIDTSKAALYFQPFLTNAPTNNSFTLNRLPSFTFTVQKQRFADLKENLDYFRIMVKREGTDWQPYVDFIPIDYNSVRLHPDNLRPNVVETLNGTYEDKFKLVTYAQDNSQITVQSKAVDRQGNASDQFWENGGKRLSDGSYQWKVQAQDHAGQLQETDTQGLRIDTRQVLTTRPYFPLIVTHLGGTAGNVHLSTDYLEGFRDAFTLTTPTPMVSGIAVVGATVTFRLTDRACNARASLLCTTTYETTVKPDSRYRIIIANPLKPGRVYEVTASVKDTGDNYNELPPFTVQVGSP